MICGKAAQAQSHALLPSWMIIGLTGGIGCGKSTAARFFGELGFGRIDSDDIIRREVLTVAEVEAAIGERFGSGVLTAEGRVSRPALAAIVFSDDQALSWLEQLVHPRLYAIWRETLASDRGRKWVVEVPLLFEKRLENWFDFTVCVSTSSTHQFARLLERGLPRALAEQRISKQLPLAQKLEFADFVLSNDGSLDFLRDQITRLVGSFGGSR
jgi:dephospho-CoA kinase